MTHVTAILASLAVAALAGCNDNPPPAQPQSPVSVSDRGIPSAPPVPGQPVPLSPTPKAKAQGFPLQWSVPLDQTLSLRTAVDIAVAEDVVETDAAEGRWVIGTHGSRAVVCRGSSESEGREQQLCGLTRIEAGRLITPVATGGDNGINYLVNQEYMTWKVADDDAPTTAIGFITQQQALGYEGWTVVRDLSRGGTFAAIFAYVEGETTIHYGIAFRGSFNDTSIYAAYDDLESAESAERKIALLLALQPT